MKVLTVVGTRPELIKLSEVIKKVDHFFEHVLVHTGQNYDFELNEIFYSDLGVRKPDYFLGAAGTPMETIANSLVKVDEILEKERPDAFLVYGDTNSCITVLAAKRKKIPIFHLEAGNRCFDLRVPEEINRKIVDHASDVNFVHSEHARRYLIDEGLAPETIFKSGTPMVEIFKAHQKKIENSKVLETFSLEKQGYCVLSCHREENVDNPQNFKEILNSLKKLTTHYDKKVFFSVHPRTRKKIEKEHPEILEIENVIFSKPVGFSDYIHLQKNAFCVLSDSGTLTEESSLLGFPAIMIRKSHERPEGMDVGAVVMSGVDWENIKLSIDLVTQDLSLDKDFLQIHDYQYEHYSSLVVRTIQSYTGFINRERWKKSL